MRQILRCQPLVLAAVALLLVPTMAARAQQPGATNTAIEAQLRQAIREYDDALRRGDVEAIGRFYAQEYVFVQSTRSAPDAGGSTRELSGGPNGPRLRRACSAGRSVPPVWDDVVVYTAVLTLSGRYSGQAQQGQHRAMVV